jgi:hypothetical protein
VIFALKKNNMADKDLTRGIKIYLDTTKYSQGMKQLSQATREYEFTLKGLREAGKGNTEQAKRLEAQIAQNKKIYQQYSAELDRQKRYWRTWTRLLIPNWWPCRRNYVPRCNPASGTLRNIPWHYNN